MCCDSDFYRPSPSILCFITQHCVFLDKTKGIYQIMSFTAEGLETQNQNENSDGGQVKCVYKK